MTTRKGKIRWGATLNALLGIAAAVADPRVLALLPARVSSALVVTSLVLGALLKPVARTDPERRS